LVARTKRTALQRRPASRHRGTALSRRQQTSVESARSRDDSLLQRVGRMPTTCGRRPFRPVSPPFVSGVLSNVIGIRRLPYGRSGEHTASVASEVLGQSQTQPEAQCTKRVNQNTQSTVWRIALIHSHHAEDRPLVCEDQRRRSSLRIPRLEVDRKTIPRPKDTGRASGPEQKEPTTKCGPRSFASAEAIEEARAVGVLALRRFQA